MALYLDSETRAYLERKFKAPAEADFVGKLIRAMLKDDRERLDNIAGCKHKPVEYTGSKTCCGVCGSFYKTGMGERWYVKEA